MQTLRTTTTLAAALASLSVITACGKSTGPGSGNGPSAHPSGTLGAPIPIAGGRPFGIAFAPTGIVYVTLQDANSVLPIDLATRTAGALIPAGADPGDVAFDLTGRTAYVSGYNDGYVHTIDVNSGTPRDSVRVAANAYRLALARTAQQLFVSSEDGTVYVVSTTNLAVTDSIPLGGPLQGMTLNASATTLYLSSTSGTVFEIDAATGAVTDTAAVGGSPQDVALSPDGKLLYVANQTGWVDVLDANTLAPLHRFAIADAFGMRPTPDGTQLYVTSPTLGEVTVLDATTGAVLHTFNVGGSPRRVAFDAAGTTAVIANENNEVDVVN